MRTAGLQTHIWNNNLKSLLLLGAYPALEGLSESLDTESIVLVATATSIVVQGATLHWVASRIPGAGSAGVETGIVSERAKAGG